MPIYEYECEKCGRVHEILQKITDKPLVACPGCKGRLHKRISQCTFHLKGTGWYATDYAGSSNSNSTPAKKKSDSPVDKASSDKKTGADSKKID